MHLELQGPCRVALKDGVKDFMIIIDDYSMMAWVYFLKIKDKTFQTFKQWKMMIEKQTGRQVTRLRTDNGLEYFISMLDEFYSKEGIVGHHNKFSS